ncbi:MAG: beta galactosidase jelly roll domain-containing protein, partial [Planctomycetes bacterium]|nr:beta galactosidase jelly roll domain-containing protein [Planctomycetota bacterium]
MSSGEDVRGEESGWGWVDRHLSLAANRVMRLGIWVVVVGFLWASVVRAGEVGDSPRRDVVLGEGWRFVRADVAGAEAIDFDDSGWERVRVPHTWNAEDAQSRADYYRGPGWYRTRVVLGADEVGAGKRRYLRFEAVSVVADVFVNGRKIGQHRGAFTAFCFDATDALKAGENIIAVRADNTKFPDIAPISGDFAIFGGIYRDVHLLTLNERCIDPLDDASPGVTIVQEQVTPESAVLRTTLRLRNGLSKPWDAKVRFTVRDPDGKAVPQLTIGLMTNTWALQGNWVGEVTRPYAITNPKLWNGRPTTSSPAPYLYSVTVETFDGDTMTDRVTVPLGLRTI